MPLHRMSGIIRAQREPPCLGARLQSLDGWPTSDLVAYRRDSVTADAAGRSEYFHCICPTMLHDAADLG